MAFFDSIQNLIFGKKKSVKDVVENDALGKVVGESGISQGEEQLVSRETVSTGANLDIEGLAKAIELQKEKIQELESQLVGTKKHFTDYEQAKKNLSDQESALTKQEKEYSKYLSYQGILPAQKQEIQRALSQIRKSLQDIKAAKRQNEDFINKVKRMASEVERAIKVNTRAVEENERSLALAKKSGPNVQFQAKGIEEIERQVESEIPEKEIPVQSGSVVVSQPAPVQQIASSDDDYWEKGRIK